jgi:hypothetical protein
MSYVEYDELGIVEIRCMNCGTPIVMRNYKTVTIRSIPPKEVNIMTLTPLSCFRKRKYNIGTHGYVEVMLCNECVDLPRDPDKMEKAIEDGWDATWRYHNKPETEKARLRKTLPILEGSKIDKKNKYLKIRGGKNEL